MESRALARAQTCWTWKRSVAAAMAADGVTQHDFSVDALGDEGWGELLRLARADGFLAGNVRGKLRLDWSQLEANPPAWWRALKGESIEHNRRLAQRAADLRADRARLQEDSRLKLARTDSERYAIFTDRLKEQRGWSR